MGDDDDRPPIIPGKPEDYINAVFKRPHGVTPYRIVDIHGGRRYGFDPGVKVCVCETSDGTRFVPWHSLNKMHLVSIRAPQWS